MISCQNKHCAAPRVLCFSISFKVSSVLCQISCFSLHVCQLQIKSRSLIDKSQYKNKLTNTHANVVRPFGSHYQNIKKYQVLEKNILSFLSGLSLSIPLGSHSVAYVQQLRGCDKKNSLQVFTEQETDWREENVIDLYFRTQHPWSSAQQKMRTMSRPPFRKFQELNYAKPQTR